MMRRVVAGAGVVLAALIVVRLVVMVWMSFSGPRPTPFPTSAVPFALRAVLIALALVFWAKNNRPMSVAMLGAAIVITLAEVLGAYL